MRHSPRHVPRHVPPHSPRHVPRPSWWRSPRLRAAALVLLLGAGAACTYGELDPPDPGTIVVPGPVPPPPVDTGIVGLARTVRQLAAGRVGRLPRPAPVRPALVRLGEALAFDPLLSGGRDVSCMTCHVPDLATADGRSLSVGEGGTGLGPAREHPRGVFIPRNAPPLLGLAGARALFHDGRVEATPDGRLRTPAGARLTPEMARVFEFGPLSAVALFPVADRAEMRGAAPGAPGNELAAIPDDDLPAIWAALMRRLGQFGEYRALFEAAYPGTRFDAMTFAHASNAIAGYLVARLTLADSPWDRFLGGDNGAMTEAQLRGARTFFTQRCVTCHLGPTLSDQQFHNTLLPQVGPGMGHGTDGRDDFGRGAVTGQPAERYAFRTPPLLNVELTAPYGHAGQFAVLRDFVEHYDVPEERLRRYDVRQLEPALHATLVPNTAEVLATRDPLVLGMRLTPVMIDELTEFLRALTDPAARSLASIVPARVPSGLPVVRR